MTTTYVIPGVPIALPRARASKHGFYDPSYKAKLNLQWLFKETYPNHPTHQKAISITISFYMPIPKKTSKKKKAAMIGTQHTKAKDVDNLLKWVFDSLNGIMWEDDRLIWKVDAKKIYDENPRTEFTIEGDL